MHYLFLGMMVAYLGGNIYIFRCMLPLLGGWPTPARWALYLLFWVAALALFIAMGLRHSSAAATLARPLFIVGSTWMILTLYMVLALLLVELLRWVGCPLSGDFLYALGATLLLLAYGHYNYRHPHIERLDIALEKPLQEELRVVMLSDVHLGYGTGKRALQRYVRMIKQEEPDLILIAGDLIDNAVEPLQRERMEEELRELKAPLGVYMVPGNHEYISGIDPCGEFLTRTPIRLLRDEVVAIGKDSLQLVGRDDRSNLRRRSLQELLNRCNPERPIVVLDHQPYALRESDSLRVDLQLSGHTHHGQVWPLNLLTDHLYEQSHGYRRWSHSHIYVSSGLSLWGPPFRIGTHSDLAVIRLHGAPSQD